MEESIQIKVATGDIETIPNSTSGYTVRFFRDLSSLPRNIRVKDEIKDLMYEFKAPWLVISTRSKQKKCNS
jgi:hypothetical protein